MSGYTGPTGPTGINGIHGRQGEVGPVGERGNRGPIADGGSSKMQYQSFYVIGESVVSSGPSNSILRPVFQNSDPFIELSHIPGMQIVDSNTLSVPRGTYCVQASSVGVDFGFGAGVVTSALAIGDTSVSATSLLAGTPTYGSGVPLVLDGIITFNSTTNVQLRHYKSTNTSLFVPSNEGSSSWTCFISFMKIQ